MVLKNVKLAELNGKNSTNFLNTENVKVFKQNTNAYVVTRIIKKVWRRQRGTIF